MDRANCGTCGNACATGQICQAGQCQSCSSSAQCSFGQFCRQGSCSATTTDDAVVFTTTGIVEPQKLAIDNNDNLLIAGSHTNTLTIGATTLTAVGNYDIFAAKLSPTTNTLWATGAGGAAEDRGAHMTVDNAGNMYINGLFGRSNTSATFPTDPPTTFTPLGAQDAYLVRLQSTDGLASWVRRIGGDGLEEAGGIIAAVKDGSTFLSGTITGPVTFCTHTYSQTTKDVYVIAYDDKGNCLWMNTYGNASQDDEATRIAFHADTSALYTGVRFPATATFGSTTLTSAGGLDAALLRLNASSGAVIWAKQITSASNVQLTQVIADPFGAFVAGTFTGTVTFDALSLTSKGGSDIFVARITNNGVWLWAKRFGGFFDDDIRDIALGSLGRTYFTGSIRSLADFGDINLSSIGNTDAFVAALDANGRAIWAERAGGSGADVGYSLAIYPNERIAVLGTFSGNASFGSLSRTGGGLFLWRFLP